MKMKILVIDDDALLRRSLQHGLEREGYIVTTAADGASGLDAARHDSPISCCSTSDCQTNPA
jgi:DNA-binding response OmpR family regulator